MSQSPQRKKTSTVKLLAELFAGICSGFLVSPLNTVVDKSIVEYANGKTALWKGVEKCLRQLLTTPGVFLASFEFKWMLTVYTLTYTASNQADHINISDHVSQPIQKLLIVFLVNTTSSLLKDKAYIQYFGRTQPKSFPYPALFLLFTRDILAMAAAFTLPSMLSKMISMSFNISQRWSQSIAQITCPLVVQIVATPIHLLGLDLYNNQDASLTKRLQYIKSIYANSLALRMMRFLPAYGLGGIFNTELRRYLDRFTTAQ